MFPWKKSEGAYFAIFLIEHFARELVTLTFDLQIFDQRQTCSTKKVTCGGEKTTSKFQSGPKIPWYFGFTIWNFQFSKITISQKKPPNFLLKFSGYTLWNTPNNICKIQDGETKSVKLTITPKRLINTHISDFLDDFCFISFPLAAIYPTVSELWRKFLFWRNRFWF